MASGPLRPDFGAGMAPGELADAAFPDMWRLNSHPCGGFDRASADDGCERQTCAIDAGSPRPPGFEIDRPCTTCVYPTVSAFFPGTCADGTPIVPSDWSSLDLATPRHFRSSASQADALSTMTRGFLGAGYLEHGVPHSPRNARALLLFFAILATAIVALGCAAAAAAFYGTGRPSGDQRVEQRAYGSLLLGEARTGRPGGLGGGVAIVLLLLQLALWIALFEAAWSGGTRNALSDYRVDHVFRLIRGTFTGDDPAAEHVAITALADALALEGNTMMPPVLRCGDPSPDLATSPYSLAHSSDWNGWERDFLPDVLVRTVLPISGIACTVVALAALTYAASPPGGAARQNFADARAAGFAAAGRLRDAALGSLDLARNARAAVRLRTRNVQTRTATSARETIIDLQQRLDDALDRGIGRRAPVATRYARYDRVADPGAA